MPYSLNNIFVGFLSSSYLTINYQNAKKDPTKNRLKKGNENEEQKYGSEL